MIKLTEYYLAMKYAAADTFTEAGVTGEFFFGYREDMNRMANDAVNATIIAEIPQWKLFAADDVSAAVTQKFLMRLDRMVYPDPDTGEPDLKTGMTMTVDALQSMAIDFLSLLTENNNVNVRSINRPMNMLISPDGFTTDNSVVIMFDVEITVTDCIIE